MPFATKAKPVTLTQARLRELLRYDGRTGLFHWRVAPPPPQPTRIKVGAVAGCRMKNGRRTIRIGGQMFYAYHLVFLYVEGALPKGIVDHDDGDCTNDRWMNLIDTTQRNNNLNPNNKWRKFEPTALKRLREQSV